MLALEVCDFSAQLLHFIVWRRCPLLTRSPVLFVRRRFLVLFVLRRFLVLFVWRRFLLECRLPLEEVALPLEEVALHLEEVALRLEEVPCLFHLEAFHRGLDPEAGAGWGAGMRFRQSAMPFLPSHVRWSSRVRTSPVPSPAFLSPSAAPAPSP
jgi:hypothetical protein